jgi:(R,R)-butanediol dehydrogenase/meso-butanediol dehydrogenase/diacetyl reductase
VRAVRWHARLDVRYEQVPDPPVPGPGEIKVEVAFCGICGSDVHEYLAGPRQIPAAPHPLTGRCPPVVLGHEVAGWVADAGPGARLPIGTPVALNALEPCGRCRQCQAGAAERCEILGHIGISADGGLADFATVPGDMAVPLPAGLPLDVAALAEPFAVAGHAVAQAGQPLGRRCLVLGAGTIGLATALLLRQAGNQVSVGDIDSRRLAAAAELGLPAAGPDEVAADFVFECAGTATAPGEALRRAAPGGLVVLTGLPVSLSQVDARDLVLRELRVAGSVGHLVDPDLTSAVRYLAGHVSQARRLITSVVPLADTVKCGLECLSGPERNRHTKVLVQVASDASARRYRSDI